MPDGCLISKVPCAQHIGYAWSSIHWVLSACIPHCGCALRPSSRGSRGGGL